MRKLGLVAAILGLGLSGLQAGVPVGTNVCTVGKGAQTIRVFTFKPANFSGGPIFFVFHGMKRNAEDYRDYAIPLAKKYRAMVAAPLMDAEQFPSHAYARGNPGSAGDAFDRASEVIRTILAREGNPRRDYYLIGHSAGGQFVSRYAVVEPVAARRVVAANPGTLAFPRLDWDWPYGLGGLPSRLREEANLRRYLAAPLTVFLGQADTNNTVESGNFDASAEANREGAHRLERGRNFFESGRKLAEEKGWAFGWKKIETPGIGHDGKLMMNDLGMEEAMGIKNKAP